MAAATRQQQRTPDLETMALEELVKLKEAAQERIELMRQEAFQELLEDVRMRATALDIAAEDLGAALMGIKNRGVRTRSMRPKSSIVKYKNPDSDQTWSGRGRKPKWFIEHMEKGTYSEEAMRVGE